MASIMHNIPSSPDQAGQADVLIRQLNFEDAVQFKEIRLQALQLHPDFFGSSVEEEKDQSIQEIENKIRYNTSGALFGAFLGEGLVGVVGVQQDAHFKSAHKSFIWTMFVKSSMRGRRVGAQLLDRALDFAKDQLHSKKVYLNVAAHNKAAFGLYLKRGFNVCGFDKDALLVDNMFYDEILMDIWL